MMKGLEQKSKVLSLPEFLPWDRSFATYRRWTWYKP